MMNNKTISICIQIIIIQSTPKLLAQTERAFKKGPEILGTHWQKKGPPEDTSVHETINKMSLI